MGFEPTSSSVPEVMVPQAGVIAMLDHGPSKNSQPCLPILIYARHSYVLLAVCSPGNFLMCCEILNVGILMRVESCQHGELEFLGGQRTEGGENLYYRCKKCGDVLIILPGGKGGFIIRGVKKSD